LARFVGKVIGRCVPVNMDVGVTVQTLASYSTATELNLKHNK